MILVTGATGNTGAAVLRALAEQNAAVRAFVHDPEKLSAPAGVEAAARVLTEPGHQGRACQLTGPEALNDDDIAARLSEVLGRTVTHVQVPWEAVRESLAALGLPEWGLDGFKELSDLYETGVAAWVSPDSERLLGRPPRDFADFAADYRAAFGG